jgi:hypothetical protein
MDYFFRLAQRALNTPGLPLAQPRLPSRYEIGDTIGQPGGLIAQDDPSEQRQATPTGTTVARAAVAAARLVPLPAASADPTLAPVQPSPVTESPSLPSQHAAPTVPFSSTLSGHVAPPPEPASMSQQPAEAALGAPAQPQPAVVRPIVSALRPEANHHGAALAALDRSQLEPGLRSGTAPSIRVTIGRIDVRAVMPPAPPARRAPPAAAKPAQGLEDYLRAGKGGSSKP